MCVLSTDMSSNSDENDSATTNNGNNNGFGDCPKAKKSKPSEDECSCEKQQSKWAYLPSIVIHEIFDLLDDEKDRLSASSACKNWRQFAFHPKWWSKKGTTFEIQPNEMEKARFFTDTMGKIASRVTIKVNTLSSECTDEFIRLLKVLSENSNLKELIIEPTYCHFAYSFNSNIKDILGACLPNLHRFSIGCVEDLSHDSTKYLNILTSSNIKQSTSSAAATNNNNNLTHLGLASVKVCPEEYEPTYFSPVLIKSLKKLQILSIDYDQLSDEFLSNLDDLTHMERLVVHLHGISDKHQGTTESSWRRFKSKHPECQLRLTVIHAYREIGRLHETVLKREMPLTHLKVFFCENINLDLLECLSAYYPSTMRSLMWIDSLDGSGNKSKSKKSERSWSFTLSLYDNSPDPVIMMAWLCQRLEEIVMYGYKYYDENLMAIARLRGDKLKVLEIADFDVLIPEKPFSSSDGRVHFVEDIGLHLGRSWRPKKDEELHPVIRDPIGGDSDEYMLPIVLADLR